ncbi:MAG: hypothetical protein WBF16_02130 [Candidatus Deferrimicrobiaceae bacterium]
MKHEETLKKAIQASRDDDDDVLLRLALLKERADYRKFFTVALREAVETAYSKIWTSPDFVDNRQVWFDAALSKSWGLTFPMWL